MRPPRRTSATPVASSSRVASATSSAKARPIRRPTHPGQRDRDERERQVQPRPRARPAPSRSATTAWPSDSGTEQARLPLVVARDARRGALDARDVHVEAVRVRRFDGRLASAHIPFHRVEDSLRQLRRVVLARRRVERAKVRVDELRRAERDERDRRDDREEQPLPQPRRPAGVRVEQLDRLARRRDRHELHRARATAARIVTYAGSAATLAIVIASSTSSNCVDRSFVSGRSGGVSVSEPHGERPQRDRARRGARAARRGRRPAPGPHASRPPRAPRAAAARGASTRKVAASDDRRSSRAMPHEASGLAPLDHRRIEQKQPRREGDDEQARRRPRHELDARAAAATRRRAACFTPSSPWSSRASWSASSHAGRSTSKVDPRPTSLSTSILPPCISTRRRAMASPSPVPRRRARSSLVCLYSWKMTARSCGLMPGPVSRTLHARVAALAADLDDDLAALRELDGVADEVREHLPHALLVGAREDARLALDADRRRAAAPTIPAASRTTSHATAREIHARARELELPALERAELEDVVDEVEPGACPSRGSAPPPRAPRG